MIKVSGILTIYVAIELSIVTCDHDAFMVVADSRNLSHANLWHQL